MAAFAKDKGELLERLEKNRKTIGDQKPTFAEAQRKSASKQRIEANYQLKENEKAFEAKI
jgi:hypothetical protein